MLNSYELRTMYGMAAVHKRVYESGLIRLLKVLASCDRKAQPQLEHQSDFGTTPFLISVSCGGVVDDVNCDGNGCGKGNGDDEDDGERT